MQNDINDNSTLHLFFQQFQLMTVSEFAIKKTMFTSNTDYCLRTASVYITCQISYHSKIKRTDIKIVCIIVILRKPTA